MVNFKDVKEAAIQEVDKEKMDEAKNRYKIKLKQLEDARKVVRNVEREIEDLEDELSQD